MGSCYRPSTLYERMAPLRALVDDRVTHIKFPGRERRESYICKFCLSSVLDYYSPNFNIITKNQQSRKFSLYLNLELIAGDL